MLAVAFILYTTGEPVYIGIAGSGGGRETCLSLLKNIPSRPPLSIKWGENGMCT